MAAYILKRILLMIPTLIGVMLITFIVTQFVPGGPVERMLAELRPYCRWRGNTNHSNKRSVPRGQRYRRKKKKKT